MTASAAALLLDAGMSARFEVIVKGIDDPAVAADVEKTIRGSFAEMALPGDWRVVVKPSSVSGRFDFLVHGLDVRHALSIAVPPALLSSLIPSRLRESLERRSTFVRAIAPTVEAGGEMRLS